MSASSAPSLVWFRQDLRLADNPALCAGADAGPVVALYVLDDETAGAWAMGGASRWWLDKSLRSLRNSLAAKGVSLILRRGDAKIIVPEVAGAVNASGVYWNRCYEPFAIARDAKIKDRLKADGRAAESRNGALLFEPWEVQTGSGGPYRVFTPFWRALQEKGLERDLLAVPDLTGADVGDVDSDDLDAWGLHPTQPDWSGGLAEAWTPGESGAHGRLGAFVQHHLAGYDEARDRPGVPGTSRLSPHLHWGEISPGQVVAAVRAHEDAAPENDVRSYLSEIAWREFSHSLLYHNPDFPNANYNAKFNAFPWRADADTLTRWQTGQTGYPIVDAGMRELYETGWMHNRVRMIVGSFLVKHLLLDWREGEAWFWDCLVDADLASNAAGWQWIAGSGADAAPYFRIFNPMTQGEKFDPDGAYVRHWCPELKNLPAKTLHQPWTARPIELADAGVTLGRTYPEPIVDHKQARQRALDAYDVVKAA